MPGSTASGKRAERDDEGAITEERKKSSKGVEDAANDAGDRGARVEDEQLERQEAAEAARMEDDEEEEEEEQQEEELEEYESSSSQSTTTSTLTWITWFCSLPGHEYFCEVAEEFIEDDFNLTGLSALVPFYREAMEMVLDVEPEDESQRVPDVSIVESSAELLYGLVHQRYIITRQGLQQMFAKYEAGHFGSCPRVMCSPSKLLPCGRSDLPGVDTVKLYCPCCVDMYVPPSSRFLGVDGAFFGTTFAHLLLQTYPAALPFPSSGLLPKETRSQADEEDETTPFNSRAPIYVPKIYGFRVSERAKSGPRMMWLRMRPRYEGEVDDDLNDDPNRDARHTSNAARSNSGPGRGGGGSGGPSKFSFGDEDDEDDNGNNGGGGGPKQDGMDNEDEEQEEDVGEAMEGVTKAAAALTTRSPTLGEQREIKALPSRTQQHQDRADDVDTIAKPPKAIIKNAGEDANAAARRIPLNSLAVQ